MNSQYIPNQVPYDTCNRQCQISGLFNVPIANSNNLYNNICQNINTNVSTLAISFQTTAANVESVPSNDTNAFPYYVLTKWSSTPNFNNGGVQYNGSTGQFTIPYSGWYNINIFVTWQENANGYREIYIAKSLAAIPSQYDQIIASQTNSAANVTGAMRITISAIAYLNIGDSLYVCARQNSGVALNIFNQAGINTNQVTPLEPNTITIKQI